MKVGYIISMAKGGVPAFTYREIDILTRRGMHIAICPLTYRTGPYMPKPEWPVFRIRVLALFWAQIAALVRRPGIYLSLLGSAVKTGAVREFLIAILFAGRLQAWGAQHIHCHFGDSKLYTGYFCSVWLDLPLTATVHAYEIHRNPNPRMFKLAAQRCSKIVVQSEYNRRLVEQKLGVPADKLVIIRAHGDMCDSRSIGKAKILIVGEFRQKKGHEVLFSAIKQLGRKDITLWVVGEGPLDVPAMAEDMGIADQIVFLGTLGKDLLSILYEACDIFVLPSRTADDGDSEGIPAVLMEAMSYGKPVISTRHAGIPELVEEIIVEENDVDGLAAAIAALVDDPKVSVQLGRRNVEVIKGAFSEQAVIELGDLYVRSAHPASTER